MLSAFKPSDDGDHLVLRLYETDGEASFVDVEPAFPVSRVEERDLMEGGVLSRPKRKGNGFRDRLKAFEIKTYLLVVNR
jgi:alpha-mannosidase